MSDTSPTLGSPRPRTHAEINEYRRKAFVEGAIASLAEYGVSGTTVATICKKAGSSRGLLGHYFSTKDEVIVAALKHLFDRISTSIKTALDRFEGTATEKLFALPEFLFAPEIFTELNRTAFLALWHETRFNPNVRKANRKLYRAYINRVEVMVETAARERGTSVNARRVALTFVAISDGLWLELSIHDGVITGQQAIEISRDVLIREFGA